MRCPICGQPVEPEQPSIPLPELAGGGNAHVACFDQIKPWVKRLHDEFDLDDYTGLLED